MNKPTFKKIDITFASKKIRKTDILSVYEYRGYYVAKYQFYTRLTYNFGQQEYGGFKEAWGVFDKGTYKKYLGRNTRKACKKSVDRLIEIGKKFDELEGKEYFQVIQAD